ncbi:uncharacterized protein LOC111705173 isoform X2 [Eurytemora carolleeae]|uniref:uncharacterized protein LOC111705173 isoform X2 n=1 Tax=Eurytemora carolleeae TaxID=1294199 RepID=UPI000C78AEEF|nr:uncharacterized protein LOC111705173 isoform X2 [Eurytemora carolleeae]|eukprot:XP_023333406.1 uncharacterized protein LOC111705173 isoform X2 [Eurytemora affinis]
MEGKMRNRLHSCEECQDVYNVSEKEIVVHMLLAHESAYCWSCETLFESRDEKVLHDDFSHFVLRCSNCSEVLKDEVQLALHAKQAHKVVICGYCSVWIEADTYPEHSAIIHKISHPASSPKSHISSKSHNPNPSQSLPLSHKRKNIVTLENLAEHIISKNIAEPSTNLKHTIQYICNLCDSFHKNFRKI